MGKTPLDNYAVAVAGAPMTGRTKDVIALLPAQQHGLRHGEWKSSSDLSIGLAGEQRRVITQFAARDCIRDERTRGAAIREKCAGSQRTVTRLCAHDLETAVRPAGSKEERS